MKRFSIVAALMLLLAAVSVPAQAADALPSAPRHVKFEGRGAHTLTFSWSAPRQTGLTALEGYNVYTKTVGSDAWILGATSTTTSVSISGLTSGADYQIKVAAFNAAGEGPAALYGQSLSLSAGADFV